MEMLADDKEALWQAARCGSSARLRPSMGQLSVATSVRPGQSVPQAPLRILCTGDGSRGVTLRSRPVALQRRDGSEPTLLEALHGVLPQLFERGIACRWCITAHPSVQLRLEVLLDVAPGADASAAVLELDGRSRHTRDPLASDPGDSTAVLAERSLDTVASLPADTPQVEVDTDALIRDASTGVQDEADQIQSQPDVGPVTAAQASDAAQAIDAAAAAEPADAAPQEQVPNAEGDTIANAVDGDAGRPSADEALAESGSSACEHSDGDGGGRTDSSASHADGSRGTPPATSGEAHSDSSAGEGTGAALPSNTLGDRSTAAAPAKEGAAAASMPSGRTDVEGSSRSASTTGHERQSFPQVSESGGASAPADAADLPLRIVKARLRPGAIVTVAGLRCQRDDDRLLRESVDELYAVLRAPDLFLYVTAHMPGEASML